MHKISILSPYLNTKNHVYLSIEKEAQVAEGKLELVERSDEFREDFDDGGEDDICPFMATFQGDDFVLGMCVGSSCTLWDIKENKCVGKTVPKLLEQILEALIGSRFIVHEGSKK